MRTCSLPNCEVKHFCKGYCRVHFERWRRHGSPHVLLKALSKRGAPMAWLREHASHKGEACLIWPFARHPDGRAHMRLNKRTVKPSRLMCELAHGPSLTEQHEAAHSCGKGNEGCVHPGHLRWAFPVENTADKFVHGTIPRGEACYNSRVTEDDVREIRALHGQIPQKAIAARFGVHKVTVHKIIWRQTWRHVA